MTVHTQMQGGGRKSKKSGLRNEMRELIVGRWPKYGVIKRKKTGEKLEDLGDGETTDRGFDLFSAICGTRGG